MIMAKFFGSIVAVLLSVASVDAFGLATFNASKRQRTTVPRFMRKNKKALSSYDFIALQEISRGCVRGATRKFLPGFKMHKAGKGIATLWNGTKWTRLMSKASMVHIKGDGGERPGSCLLNSFLSKKNGKKALVVNCHLGHNPSTWKRARNQVGLFVTKHAKRTGISYDSIILMGDLNEILGHKVVSQYHEPSLRGKRGWSPTDHICVWNTPTLTYKYDKTYGSDHKAVMAYTK